MKIIFAKTLVTAMATAAKLLASVAPFISVPARVTLPITRSEITRQKLRRAHTSTRMEDFTDY